jgi:glycosyltransferase involved in cell wall biosynthesis
MNEYKFTVILSIYYKTTLDEIKRALLSLKKQTLQPNEIIIVFDGPCSLSVRLYVEFFLKKFFFKKFLILKSKFNLGIAYSYNLAIRHSRYNLVAIQDSDDISLSDRFKLQVKAFSNNKNLAVLGGYILEKSSNKNFLKKVPIKFSSIKKYIFFKNPINHPTVMFKKNKLKLVNFYTHCQRMEDYYLWIKLISKNFIIQNIPFILVNSLVNQEFLIRRTSRNIIFSELKIQLLLLKNNKIYILAFPFIFSIKIIYHLMPIIIKRFIRPLINSF